MNSHNILGQVNICLINVIIRNKNHQNNLSLHDVSQQLESTEIRSKK